MPSSERAAYQKRKYMTVYRAKKYGLTTDELAALIAEANGRCAICREEMDPLHVDHDHETGLVRGLLCNGCNTGLGMFRDSECRLVAAIEYLRKRQSKAS